MSCPGRFCAILSHEGGDIIRRFGSKAQIMATKDVSDPNKRISVTQPGARLGKEFHQTRASLPPSKYNPRYQSNSFAESLGDSAGFNTIDQKRYQVILHPDEKGTRHGFDAVLRERETGKVIVIEHKGQNATESKAQQQPDKWIWKVNEKTIKGEGSYTKSTRQEVAASHAVDRAMRDGNLEYQLHRTHIDVDGRVHTDVEKQLKSLRRGKRLTEARCAPASFLRAPTPNRRRPPR